MKNGALLDWGLVEYINPAEAEETYKLVNNTLIQGHPVRIQYFVPGVRAVNIMIKLFQDTVNY